MKKSIFTLTLLLFALGVCHAGGSVWPGIKYSYAKVYLYNVKGELRGSHQILKEGNLDKTVQGEGKKLSDAQAAQLEKIFASGPAIDELVNGLSGCYIPRHAIVYYDSKDQPVASMSICFECQGIRFYSPSYPRNAYKSSEKLVKKAEEKLKEIKAIITSLGFETEFNLAEPSTETEGGTMTITDPHTLDSLLPEKITLENYRQYFSDKEDIKVFEDEKYTAGGDKFVFTEVVKGKSSLYFSGKEDNASLEKAVIMANDIGLLKKVKIGMSTDDVQALFPVYDGISAPTEITLQNTDGSKKVVFKLADRQLVEYSLEIRIW